MVAGGGGRGGASANEGAPAATGSRIAARRQTARLRLKAEATGFTGSSTRPADRRARRGGRAGEAIRDGDAAATAPLTAAASSAGLPGPRTRNVVPVSGRDSMGT